MRFITMQYLWKKDIVYVLTKMSIALVDELHSRTEQERYRFSNSAELLTFCFHNLQESKVFYLHTIRK